MPTRAVPTLARDFLERAEACILTPYQDPTGVWTDGYGNTKGVIPHGPPISQAQADADLAVNMDNAANELSERVTDAALFKLDEHQYAALISFVFNVGAGPGWTIWRDLSTGNTAGNIIPTQLLRFDHGEENGKEVVIPGLLNRRNAEIALWNTPDAIAAAALASASPTPSSGYVRTVVTPPTPIVKPLAGPSLMTKVVGGVTALGAGAAQVQTIIQPHASEAAIYGHIAVGLTGVIIVCSVIALFISHKQAAVAAT